MKNIKTKILALILIVSEALFAVGAIIFVTTVLVAFVKSIFSEHTEGLFYIIEYAHSLLHEEEVVYWVLPKFLVESWDMMAKLLFVKAKSAEEVLEENFTKVQIHALCWIGVLVAVITLLLGYFRGEPV